MIFAVILGIPLGIISATKKDKVPDHLTRIFALTGVSMPIFWFGLMLKYVLFYQFSVWGLPYLPGGDRYNIRRFSYTPTTGFLLVDSLVFEQNVYLFSDAMVHLIMPGFCLGYITLAIITRMMRSSMLEVIKEDYITLARSKGLTERVVIACLEERIDTHCNSDWSSIRRFDYWSCVDGNNIQLARVRAVGSTSNSQFGYGGN